MLQKKNGSQTVRVSIHDRPFKQPHGVNGNYGNAAQI